MQNANDRGTVANTGTQAQSRTKRGHKITRTHWSGKQICDIVLQWPVPLAGPIHREFYRDLEALAHQPHAIKCWQHRQIWEFDALGFR